MTKLDDYRAALRDLPAAEWEPYLLAHANLPGPRGNLELAAAVADAGDEAQFRRWAALGPDVAPENTPGCFLAFCGVVGLGAVMAFCACRGEVPSSSATRETTAGGETPPLQILRTLAADPRWRIREAVAMALQRWGDADMPALLAEMADWAAGNPLEQRAAAAGLCEPRLLKNPDHAAAVLRILDEITASIPPLARSETSQSKSGEIDQSGRDALKTLRQGLGYCWSVAVVARPDAGKPLMEKWLASDDPDIHWIMRENLKKNRLVKMDADWVSQLTTKSGQ